jgi:hypothetical protein
MADHVHHGRPDFPDVLRELEVENARLKKMYSDLALENAAIKELLQRKR